MKYRQGDNEKGLREFAQRFRNIASKHRPRVLEIGSFVGDSTRIFIEEIRPKEIVCVDPWDEQMPDYRVADGDILGAFFENVRPAADQHGCRLRKFQMRSVDFFGGAGNAWDRRFDMVYIDAVHTFEAVTSDISGVLPMLRKDGILAGHDHDPVKFQGVVDAVTAALKRNHGRFSHLEIYRDTTWALIPKEARANLKYRAIKRNRQLKASTSWRITAPLRAVSCGLRRLLTRKSNYSKCPHERTSTKAYVPAQAGSKRLAGSERAETVLREGD
jgi:hypothetical protein